MQTNEKNIYIYIYGIWHFYPKRHTKSIFVEGDSPKVLTHTSVTGWGYKMNNVSFYHILLYGEFKSDINPG